MPPYFPSAKYGGIIWKNRLKISMKSTNGNFNEKSLKYNYIPKKEDNFMDAEDFADIYFEIANAVGAENAVKIHSLFKGQQIQFPQKLYKKEYIYSYIKKNYNGQNIRELSQKFGYSDRRVRQIINSG